MKTLYALAFGLAISVTGCGGDPNVEDDGTVTVQAELVGNRCQIVSQSAPVETGKCFHSATFQLLPSANCVYQRRGTYAGKWEAIYYDTNTCN
jgi:hypothetical protein